MYQSHRFQYMKWNMLICLSGFRIRMSTVSFRRYCWIKNTVHHRWWWVAPQPPEVSTKQYHISDKQMCIRRFRMLRKGKLMRNRNFSCFQFGKKTEFIAINTCVYLSWNIKIVSLMLILCVCIRSMTYLVLCVMKKYKWNRETVNRVTYKFLHQMESCTSHIIKNTVPSS